MVQGPGCSPRLSTQTKDPYAEVRAEMVDAIEAQGVRDPRVLKALNEVPRHRFVSPSLRNVAYEDRPIEIGHGQKIPEPSIVASMTERLQLKPHESVLEIGTGSGYQTAVLSRLTSHVYTIEIEPALARMARQSLQALGYRNITQSVGDGYNGWPEAFRAPFDVVLVTRAVEEIPPPLLEQLAAGGRMIIAIDQNLMLIEKDEEGNKREIYLGPAQFKPLRRSSQTK